MKMRSRPYLVTIFIGLFVVLALSVFFFWRFEQAKTGICRDSGKILTGQDLRQAVLKNLVMIAVEAANVHEGLFHNGTERVGIIRNPQGINIYPTEYNIKSLMEKAYNNDRSFEENFSIEMIAPGDNGFDVNKLEEPFMLVGYWTYPGGGAVIIVSKDVRPVDPPAWSHKISLYDRFHGFGNYYYRIKQTFLSRECCDNRDYGRTREDHLKKKRIEYLGSLRSFDKNIAVHDNYVMVSNCGDLLTEKSENGMDQDVIKYTYGEKKR